eukprot:3846069-Pyramimonas_sp.AAC.1
MYLLAVSRRRNIVAIILALLWVIFHTGILLYLGRTGETYAVRFCYRHTRALVARTVIPLPSAPAVTRVVIDDATSPVELESEQDPTCETVSCSPVASTCVESI